MEEERYRHLHHRVRPQRREKLCQDLEAHRITWDGLQELVWDLIQEVATMASNEQDLESAVGAVEQAEGDAEGRVTSIENEVAQLEAQVAAGASVPQSVIDRLNAVATRLTGVADTATPPASAAPTTSP